MRLTAAIVLLLASLAGRAWARGGETAAATPELLITEASMSVETLLAQGESAGFTPFGRWTPNLGFLGEDKAAWVRIQLEGDPGRETTRVVELGITRLLHADWHVIADGRVVSVHRSGAADLEPQARPAQRIPWVEVEVPRGARRTILLRVASDTAIWLPVQVGGRPERETWELSRHAMDFSVFGACLGIALMNILLGAITRSPLYFVASTLPLAHVAYQLVFLGYHQGLDLPRWASKQGMLLLAGVLGVGLFSFTDRLLNPPEGRARRPTRLAIATGFGAAPAALLLPYWLGSQVANLLLALGGALCLAAAFGDIRRRFTAEGWLLAFGWSLPFASGIVLLLQLGGYAPAWFSPTAVIRTILPGTFILFILAAVRSQRRLRETELDLESSRRRQEEARLEALRHQLNPHLAFNTLASIETLSREAPERIPALVNRLAAFLRHRMAPSGKPFHSLGEELEAAQAYLDIERTHLEERLVTETRVSEATLRMSVPEFTLQPLVENAVKHGLAESDRVSIRIEAEVAEGILRVRVANTGRIQTPRAPLRGEGIGLENLRQRLALHLGGRARATLRQKDGWVVAEVELPAQPHLPSR